MLFLDCPELLVPIMNFLKKLVFPLLQFGVPVVLLIMGMLDFAKGVMASKEDEIKKGQKVFIRRLMAALSFFFVTTIVVIVMNILASANIAGTDLWTECWGGKKQSQNNSTPSIEKQCENTCSNKTGQEFGQCMTKCIDDRRNQQASCTQKCYSQYSTDGKKLSDCMIECDKH